MRDPNIIYTSFGLQNQPSEIQRDFLPKRFGEQGYKLTYEHSSRILGSTPEMRAQGKTTKNHEMQGHQCMILATQVVKVKQQQKTHERPTSIRPVA